MKTHKIIYHRLLLIVAISFLLSTYNVLAIFQVDLLVTNTHDSGSGSLREAILNANNTAGHNMIRFDIADDEPHTIALQSPLPTITETVTIDGTTQLGANCESLTQTLMIEIDGSDAGKDTSGFIVTGTDVVIRGLVINRFTRHGINVTSIEGHNRFECNFIGTDITGTVALGNGRSGIVINNSPNNIIGSITSGMGNLISGNLADGIAVIGLGSSYNTVIGNLIGTDLTGTSALGNRNVGIYLESASYNFVGGSDPLSRNIISGNLWEGVYIYKPSATYNIVTGNYIGTDVTGTVAVGNGDSGIVISQASYNLIGGVAPGSGNVISANQRQGIYIFAPTASQNTVIGNYIGIDVTGIQPLGNLGSGVYLDQTINNTIGGNELVEHNLIASNGEYGIYVFGDGFIDEQIYANTFGSDLDDNLGISNGLSDIHQDLQDHSQES